MRAHSYTFAILAAASLAFRPVPTSYFSLGSTGAVRLTADGQEARYGLVPSQAAGQPMIVVSLGAATAQGALSLYLPGDHVPSTGRYPIHYSWNDAEMGEPSFRASFAAGSPEHPLGWFEGERGWVTITDAGAGRLSGEFEILARGFVSSNPDDENRWVTVRGTFQARGDTGITAIASVR